MNHHLSINLFMDLLDGWTASMTRMTCTSWLKSYQDQLAPSSGPGKTRELDRLNLALSRATGHPIRTPRRQPRNTSTTSASKEPGLRALGQVCVSRGRVLVKPVRFERRRRAYWQVCEEKGLNNLAGVGEKTLDTILQPDMLAYTREVRHKGLAARYNGSRQHVRTKPHPNARRNLDQVFKQIWKDVVKQRVLVVSASHPALSKVVSSPDSVLYMIKEGSTCSPSMRRLPGWSSGSNAGYLEARSCSRRGTLLPFACCGSIRWMLSCLLATYLGAQSTWGVTLLRRSSPRELLWLFWLPQRMDCVGQGD